jgi:hypothetical protein
LLIGPAAAARLAKALRKANAAHYAAKDILRAAGLPLLAPDDSEIAADLDKVRAGKKLSPCCWSSGPHCGSLAAITGSAPAINLDEKTLVPCRMTARMPKD